jgi:hypothetical protein
MKASAKALGRLAAQLDGRERFRACAVAAAAGDHTLAEHLISSANETLVWARDREMMAMFHLLRGLTIQFDRSTVGWVAVVRLAKEMGPWTLHELDDVAGGEGGWVRDLAKMFTASLVEGCLGQLRALREALVELGRERLGLEPENLLALQPEWVQSWLEELREEIDGAPMADSHLDEARATLLGGWGPDGLSAPPEEP